MFSVKRWQLDQNSCLPNDNVRCDRAAVLTAAEVGVLQDVGWGGLDFCGSFNPPVPRRSPAGPGAGGAAWGSVALPRPLQELRGRRGSVLPCCGGLDLQRGSVRVPFLAEGARGSRRGLCRLQRASSHAGTRGATVRGDGGSWDGAGLPQLALLEPVQPVQGLWRRCGRLTRVLLRARLPSPRRQDRQVARWGAASCQSWHAAEPRSYPFKASGAYSTKPGEKKRPPPAKAAKEKREPEPLLQEP